MLSMTPYRGISELNTQVRRLAIVSALVRLLGREALSENALFSRLFRWSASMERTDPAYDRATGKVTADGGKPRREAARRYLSFTQAAGLVVKVSELYRTTRLGLVLYPFLTQSSGTIGLSLPENLFLGYLLLNYDADILLTIVTQLLVRPHVRLVDYQRGFRDRHVNRLNHRIEVSSDERVRQALLERRMQIFGWRKPKEYPEHIVPPRINWLCDLGLAEEWKPPNRPRESARRFSLTPAGKRFFWQVPQLGHAPEERDVTLDWLHDSYFSCFAECIGIPAASSLTVEARSTLLHKYVDIAFHEFRRSLAAQVPLSQIVFHAVLNICAKENAAVNYSDVVTWLTSDKAISARNSNLRYLVRPASRENEEYVILSPRSGLEKG